MLFHSIADEREGKGGGRGKRERNKPVLSNGNTCETSHWRYWHFGDFKVRQNVWTVFHFNILNHAGVNYFAPGTNVFAITLLFITCKIIIKTQSVCAYIINKSKDLLNKLTWYTYSKCFRVVIGLSEIHLALLINYLCVKSQSRFDVLSIC